MRRNGAKPTRIVDERWHDVAWPGWIFGLDRGEGDGDEWERLDFLDCLEKTDGVDERIRIFACMNEAKMAIANSQTGWFAASSSTGLIFRGRADSTICNVRIVVAKDMGLWNVGRRQ